MVGRLGPGRGHVLPAGPDRLAAPGYVASAEGVLWAGREMDSVSGGRCDVTGTRVRKSESSWPGGRVAPGLRPWFTFRVGAVKLPTNSGPSAPARILRGSRPIAGMTLPTQAGLGGYGGGAAVGQVPAGVPLAGAAAHEMSGGRSPSSRVPHA